MTKTFEEWRAEFREISGNAWDDVDDVEGFLAELRGQLSPPIRSERFMIHRHEIPRDEKIGMPRTVFQAWFHSQDIPRPVCVVTINECFSNYVEWVHVEEEFRREGIATEVVRAIEESIGGVTLDGATDAGEAFCEAYEAKFPSPCE